MIKQDISENQVKNIFLAIGSNLGNRLTNIEKAKSLLLENNINLISASSYYETRLGRKKTPKNSPRVCDIDIIDFKGLVTNDKLNLPHPRMHERNFVLLPLFEIEKDWVHPIKKTNIKKLILSLSNKDIRSIKQI